MKQNHKILGIKNEIAMLKVKKEVIFVLFLFLLPYLKLLKKSSSDLVMR